MTNKSAWLQIEDAEKDLVFNFCEDYKSFYQLQKQKDLLVQKLFVKRRKRALEIWKNFINLVKNLRREISFI